MTMVKRDSWRLCFPFSFFHSFYPNSLLSATLPLAWGIGGGGTRVIEQIKAFFVSTGTTRNILIGLIIFFLSFYYYYYKVLLQTFCCLLRLNSPLVCQSVRSSHLTSPSLFSFSEPTHCSNFYLSCVHFFVSWGGSGG